MINLKPLENIQKINNSDSVIPNYKGFSYANIMPTVFDIFGIESEIQKLDSSYLPNKQNKIKKVALIFLDALGWDSWLRFKDLEAVKNTAELGVISPLYSVFPSSTAPSVGTLNYNLMPVDHGITDARLYLPEVNELMWSFSNNPIVKSRKKNFSITTSEISSIIHPNVKTSWEILNEAGIISECIASKSMLKSDFNSHSSKGAVLKPYKTYVEGLIFLKDSLKDDERKVVQYYFDHFDIISHKHGTKSEYLLHEVESFFNAFQKIVVDQVDLSDTLLLIFADHGQIELNYEGRIYLDHIIPEFDKYLITNDSLEPIFPSGSGRNVFLNVKEECKEILIGILKDKLGDKAHVFTFEEIVELGLLGKNNIPNNEHRFGNIIILPTKNNFVWHSNSDLGSDSIATHGGLSKEEVLSCLLAI